MTAYLNFHSKFLQKHRVASDFHFKYKDVEIWDWFFSLYDGFDESLPKQRLVPKKIHQIWIGSKLPTKYKKWQESWLHHYPDFEYTLWNEEMILDMGLQNKKQFLLAKNPAVKSDLARYEILNKFGGLYVDTDFESLKRIPDRFFSVSFCAGMGFSYSPQFYNGLMIAAKSDNFLNLIIDSIGDYQGESTGTEILDYCGAHFITKLACLHKISIDNFLVLPSQYFYPYPNFMVSPKTNPYSFLTEDSYAIHHWEVSWLKKSLYKKILNKLINRIKRY